MTRISTLILFLALSFSSFAQLSVTLEDSALCAGESVWFKASGMTLYAWSDTNNLDTNLGDSVNFSTTVAGNYTITVLGYTIFPVDTDTMSFSVLVHPAPDASITSSAGTNICSGSSSELVAMGGYVTYLWTPAGSLSNDSTDTVIATPTTNTTYYLSVTDTNGCMASDSFALSVTPGPSVSITSSAEATGGYICFGGSATMTAVGSGIASYEWSPTASLNDSTSMTVTATPTVTTAYTVLATDSSGCTDTDSDTIMVNATLPSLEVVVSDDTICFGKSTSIVLQTNATSFDWSPGASLDDSTTISVVATPTTTTTYNVTVTRQGCTKIDSATIAVLPAPIISHTQSSGGAAICLDETDEITVNCPDCVSYTWKFPNSELSTANNVQVVSPNEPGAIQITITGFDGNGCGAKTIATVNVDSCFIGDPWEPFAIEEPVLTEIGVLNRGNEIELVSKQMITEVRMYNLLGEEVYANGENRTSHVIATQEFAEGLYIIRLSANGQELVKKVFIQ